MKIIRPPEYRNKDEISFSCVSRVSRVLFRGEYK